jgi:hypothetical protein
MNAFIAFFPFDEWYEVAAAGTERLGEPFRYDLGLFSPEPVDASAVLGKPCGLHLFNEHELSTAEPRTKKRALALRWGGPEQALCPPHEQPLGQPGRVEVPRGCGGDRESGLRF